MTAPLPRGATDITPTEALEIAKENLYRARHDPMSDAGRDSLRIEATAYATLATALQTVTPPEERIELVEAERAVGIWQQREASAMSILVKLKAGGAVGDYDTNQVWGRAGERGGDDNVVTLTDEEAALWDRIEPTKP